MQDMPGQSCHCSNDRKQEAGYCSSCGDRKKWINQGPHSEVYACPSCS